MKKFILIAQILLALSLTATAHAGEYDCGLSEVRAFNAGTVPDENVWMKADGRLIDINQNMALFSLLGNKYGGDYRMNFALPKVADLNLNGTKFVHYVCVYGIYPTGGTDNGNTGFLRQYAGRFNLDSYSEMIVENELELPIQRYQALASVMNKDLVTYYSLQIPTVNMPAVVLNGEKDNKMSTVLELNGFYPMYNILCEKGGLYISLGKMREPENVKEIVVDGMAGISFRGNVKESAHLYECL
ncbi:tail fiber protein [Bdellovibrio bacteriovorus]|uniref:tail fiber protein n=1 Tax=Bdellovibrio bacteriovorus TaxID=959 RepID=UPI0035A597D7